MQNDFQLTLTLPISHMASLEQILLNGELRVPLRVSAPLLFNLQRQMSDQIAAARAAEASASLQKADVVPGGIDTSAKAQ